ncbi:DUF1045 domain-containing protein [Limibaculum sp. M0105]|uniref:DUF1045 domain-containing protein n=1 Tax=Thermohalobaculum xanthum TaxID=2753746 RepID=A0A8J7M833_9RHOB|nr:DUF1045 domain-containing protein [Thermohalobaculum xanthum]MBK0399294.1 DUF1045 domain-containing protein [Thermohalobaculum xanthum]
MIDIFERFAISWVPQPGSPLARFGASWTGWCADAAERRARYDRAGLPFRPEQVTGPLEYQGLHAEIYAPFRFRRGASAWAFERELASLSSVLEVFTLPRLSVAVVEGRIVLTPATTSAALEHFIETISARLAQFDTDAEARETATARMGFVGSRFMMPLTRTLAPEEAEALARPLARELEPILAERQQILDFAVMGDPGGGRALRVIERHELAEPQQKFELRGLSCSGPRLYTGIGGLRAVN